MNEAIPIGLLASRYFNESADVSIALKIGNQNFDAIVSDNRKEKSPISYIEVTMAHEGEDEYLRMRYLHETEEVSGLGKVTKHGTKRTGLSIEVQSEMVSQAEVIERESKLLSDAIERKLAKSYPKNTLLLIAFDDVMAFDRKDNIQRMEVILEQYLPRLTAFRCVVIIGLHKGLHIVRYVDNERSNLELNPDPAACGLVG